MNDQELLYDRTRNTAYITLNRPERRNALTPSLSTRMHQAFRDAEDDDDVKVIVLRANGPSFCVGADLAERRGELYGGSESVSAGVRQGIHQLRRSVEASRALMYCLKPTIAQVHGYCVGAGLGLAICCDFIIASEDAAFGWPDQRYSAPGVEWFFPLVALHCGLPKAKELLMTGRKFDAAEADRLNMINRVVPRDQLVEEVEELVRALSTSPRDGLAITKAYMHQVYATMGLASMFVPMYTTHPLSFRMKREADEFDFPEMVKEKGLKEALAERDKVFRGRYWNY